MNQFTIKDIEAISGIKAQTLRVWEQRYGILIPKRKASKHRIYNDEDLKNILCVAHLNQHGYKISKIARMSQEEINQLTLSAGNENQLYLDITNEYLKAIKDFDEKRFNDLFRHHSANIEFENMVIHIFYPLLQQIGQCWITSDIKPAQEHFASSLISSKIDLEIQKLKRIKEGALTILFLPKGEYHRIPLLFINYLMRKAGKRSVFLGGDIDIETISKYLVKNKVAQLHMHLITEFFDSPLEEFVMNLMNICKTQTVTISGPVAPKIKFTHPQLKILSSLNALIQYCNS